jgi:hypothetical protein
MTSNGKSVNLGALLADAGTIIHPDGSEHAVKQVTGRVFHLLQSSAADPIAAQMNALYEATHSLVPTLSADQLEALTPELCQAVITIASGLVDTVQAMIPNPARTTDPTPASSSEPGAAASVTTGSAA